MITIKDKATITKDKHVITIDVGENVPEGEYEVDVILNAKRKSPSGILNFPVSNLKCPPGATFSREEMYDDDGR
jgi:hypothetical protein